MSRKGIFARSARRPTPLGVAARGVVAGISGVLAMDAVGYARHLAGGGRTPPLRYEFGVAEDWDQAPVPAQIGRRLVEGFTQRPLAARHAPLTNAVVHWGYGIGWSVAYALVAGSARRPRAVWGAPFGAAVWLAGYLLLPASGLYRPLPEYDPETLATDLGTHLAYGLATGAVLRGLLGRPRRERPW